MKISYLMGFCDEGGEKILVYEHASCGGLDRHLSATTFTWRQRLKICLAAARGLSYLHDPKETQQRVLHRDIKSSNILLDENWSAKVSDLGLSKIGPANQPHTALVSNVVGTLGYLDPMYLEMGLLTKESDVYSFGVVLFEVLCGRLCFEYSNGRCDILVRMWKKSYKQKKLDKIIFQDMEQQMDSSSLETFSDIAYLCLQKSCEERPSMADVVKQLEIALEFQEIYEDPADYEQMVKYAVPALVYRSKEELDLLLSKGILINKGKMWFSVDKNGEHIEMISAAECSTPNALADRENQSFSAEKSRFAKGIFLTKNWRYEAHVRTQFLSPQIRYTVNLVFNSLFFFPRRMTCLNLKYKLEGETKSSILYLADMREDGLMMAELYQFTSDARAFDLKIQFEGSNRGPWLLIIEGIEFRPLKKVDYEALEDDKLDMLPISDSDIDWEEKLPSDYDDIIKWSKDILVWTTKKELYFLFCKGFLINNGEEINCHTRKVKA